MPGLLRVLGRRGGAGQPLDGPDAGDLPSVPERADRAAQVRTEYLQRNYGFEEIKYKHPWVYICDADERVPKDLREELSGW